MPITHTVAQGDCMSSIASRYRFANWRTIYDHPDNEGLRVLRASPNHLLPGDEVIIPDRVSRVEERTTGARHRFVLQAQPTRLRLTLENLEPVKYLLEVDEEVFEGAGPRIAHDLRPDAQLARLHVWLDADVDEEPTLTWELSLGHLDPAGEISGLDRRLENLGHVGDSTTTDPDIRAAAVRSFQRSRDLTATGVVDASLHEEVSRVHDLDA